MQDNFSILKTPYQWDKVKVQCQYAEALPDAHRTGNVHVAPFVGNHCILLHTHESGWAMPGGTLEKGESLAHALMRELQEELGAETKQFQFFGSWKCVSSLPKPYLPHLPHPAFSIALGWADVAIVGSPMSDGGIQKETVKEIVILPVDDAIKHLTKKGKLHLAALYLLASNKRIVYKKNKSHPA